MLADFKDKLADVNVCRNEILLLVQVRNVALWCFLYNHGDAVWVLGANTLSDLLALICEIVERTGDSVQRMR